MSSSDENQNPADTADTAKEYAVAISRCKTYEEQELKRAVESAVDLAGGFDVSGKRLLIKPNVLRDADPGKAITTHPEFMRAVIRLCKERGASRILVGDSPGFAPGGFSGRRSSLRQVCDDEEVEWADFHSKKVLRAVPAPIRERAFHLTDVIDYVDLIINLPKLKTHSLMYYTGALKNLFGLVPGLAKSPFHVRFPGRNEFGEMIVDLAHAVEPHYSIMDGIIGMEGPGPGNGDPRSVGLVLASPSALALDYAATRIIGYEPEEVPTNRIGLEHEADLDSFDRIEIRGAPLDEVRLQDFRLIGNGDFSSFWTRVMHSPLLRGFERKLRKKPVFHHHRCIHCGECVNICAAGALAMTKAEGKRRIRVDYRKCIRCYCCHEICPADAITIGKEKQR